MDPIETVWQELLTSALLGTERRPPTLPTTPGQLGDVLAGLDPTDSPRYLLDAAAALALYRRAGRLPERTSANPVSACAPDELPRCNPAAAARLSAMLGGLHKVLIPEWLQLANAAHLRVPEELASELLFWGEAQQEPIGLLLPVLGKRGRWLAEQVPTLEKVRSAILAAEATESAIPVLWQTEGKSIRQLLLGRIRRSNSSAALPLLQSTWQEESAEERAAFLEILEEGLNMTDEPFLEAALDDRAKGVRAAAANLLSRLQASSLVKRQTERALLSIRFKPGGFLRKAQIEVTLPDACDEGMIRDGVQAKRMISAGLGEKGEWLFQILSTVPPSIWCQKWGKTPSELLEIAAGGEWQKLLHEGWTVAAGRHADPDWAEAVLKLDPRRSLLFNALPDERRSALLRSQLQSKPSEGMELLFGYPEPWGIDLSRMCVQQLRAYYLKSNDASWQYSFNNVIRMVGRRMDPNLLTEAAQKLPEKADPGSAWEKAVEDLLTLLDFRRQMREELNDA